MSSHSHDHVIKSFHPHPITFFVFYFIGAIFIVLGLFFFMPVIWIGCIFIALGEVSRLSETFYISDAGVAREYRLFSTTRRFAEYEKIQDLQVNQSVIENIFGIGTLRFNTAGSDAIEIKFYGVKDPYSVEKMIREKMAGGSHDGHDDHGHH